MKPILMLLASFVLLVLVFLSGVIITANVISEPEPHKFAHMDTPDLWTSEPAAINPAKQTYQRMPATTAAVPHPTTTATETASGAPDATKGAATNAGLDITATASIDTQSDTPVTGNTVNGQPPLDLANSRPQQPSVDTAQADWCYARYRSDRIEDNSYQPFDGGPRRQCQAPGQSTAGMTAPAATPAAQDFASLRQQAQSKIAPRSVPGEQVYEEEPDYGVEASYREPEPDNGGVTGAHEEWCFARYRSYQAEDNSYQPFQGGPRRMCRSPHG